jgi:Type I phosphodiesterase / nucleotide pyrophosphatase
LTGVPDRKELESLFQRGHLSRRQFVQGLIALGITAAGLEALMGVAPAAVSQFDSGSARYLVLIVLDAFRPDYINLAAMPALHTLMNAGTSYDRAWVGQLESETPVGHATIGSGTLPKHDGIIGFEWRDPATQRERLDGWSPAAWTGAVERDLHRARAHSISNVVKAADRTAKVVALSSEKVYAADAMGGWAADYVLCHRPSGTHSQTLVPHGVPGHLPPADFLKRRDLTFTLPTKHFSDWDQLSGRLAQAAVKSFHPRVLMVNLPGADVYGHSFGGPASPRVMSQVAAGADKAIQRIVQTYKAAGIFDQTLFVVTADHGMVPNSHTVLPKKLKAIVGSAGGKYYFHTGYTAAYIYLRNPSRAAKIAAAFAHMPAGKGAYYQVKSHGKYEYVSARGVKLDKHVDAVHKHLLGTFSGPTAPDVVVPYRENTMDFAQHHRHGDHGGLSWGAQHVPLIMAGPGVRGGAVSHFPARLMDVAPTALRLMGLTPKGMDGIVLADALSSASAQEVAAQVSVEPSISGLQQALQGQSQEDARDDYKAHIGPPPPLPFTPH